MQREIQRERKCTYECVLFSFSSYLYFCVIIDLYTYVYMYVRYFCLSTYMYLVIFSGLCTHQCKRIMCMQAFAHFHTHTDNWCILFSFVCIYTYLFIFVDIRVCACMHFLSHCIYMSAICLLRQSGYFFLSSMWEFSLLLRLLYFMFVLFLFFTFFSRHSIYINYFHHKAFSRQNNFPSSGTHFQLASFFLNTLLLFSLFCLFCSLCYSPPHITCFFPFISFIFFFGGGLFFSISFLL